MKEDVITWGDLELYELRFEKSADLPAGKAGVVVVRGNELSKKGRGLTNW